MKQNKQKTTTSISEIGEFGLIDKLSKIVSGKNEGVVMGIGDDSAVLESADHYQIISTDMLVEGVHFDLAYTPLLHLGYKSISVNVSDLCAMNGTAKQALVSIAISNRFPVEAVEELYNGIKLACDDYKIDIIGGDTTSSKTGLIISITVLGICEKNRIAYRNGANVNDLVVLTGDVGGAYLGLQLLKREKDIFLENPSIQPDLGGNNYVLERQLKPKAATKYIDILKDLNIIPSSMIDVSDSLASECLHLAKASNVSLHIYEEKIPIDYTVMNLAQDFKINPIFCALNGGEDYELLFTIKQSDYSKLKKDIDFTIIGHIAEKSEGNRFITKDNTSQLLTAQGWDSFVE